MKSKTAARFFLAVFCACFIVLNAGISVSAEPAGSVRLIERTRSAGQARPASEFKGEGAEFPPNYEKYGAFAGEGTAEYRFEVRDEAGLARAVGAGVFPNRELEQDPAFEAFKAAHESGVDPWKYVNGESPQDDLFAWYLTDKADAGTKLFYIGEALRRAGHFRQAIQAYYALAVHYPRTAIWVWDGSFYWFAGPEAVSRIRRLTAEYPRLGCELKDAMIEVIRSGEKDPQKDTVIARPGRFAQAELVRFPVAQLEVVEERGGEVSKAVKYKNGHWALWVDGKPYTVRGITYDCTKVGESPHLGTLRPWMTLDDNRNGQNDGMFDSWVDSNRNGFQDSDEPTVGDARLLADLGVNTIRYYHGHSAHGDYDPEEYDKELMRRLWKDHGIRFVMGDFLGAYTIGSGANWQLGTDYRDAAQRERMKKMVRSMVLDHKDEPYVLFWLLGNENAHPWAKTNAARYPGEYAKFVDEVARMIKEIDPRHAVAVCHLGSEDIRTMAKFAPSIDIYGTNVYAGAYSMGSVTQYTRAFIDRPLLFTEWGSDAYRENYGEDEKSQAEYILGNWRDMTVNMAGGTGEGNVIGGFLFEWMDEWWKSSKGPPNRHDHQGDIVFPFEDGWSNEEWLGITGQGGGRRSPYLRELRKAYTEFKSVWTRGAAGNAFDKALREGRFEMDGTIYSLDPATGELVLDVDEEESDVPLRVRMRVIPGQTEISDSANNEVDLKRLIAYDAVDASGHVENGGLIVEDLSLWAVRGSGD